MKIKEIQTKLEELKGLDSATLTEEQKVELTSLETQFADETKSKTRYDELLKKDENVLTSEEVDELITLGDRFGESENRGEETPPAGASKKYAGIYESLDDLIKGYSSSESERKRIESDPEAIKALEDGYKESQRRVTRLVADRKAAPRDMGIRKPLVERELEEMTQTEYDTWEKSNKLEAHTWLTQATQRSIQVNASRRNVFKKYPNWLAEIQGIVEPSKELIEWDKLDKENLVDRSDPVWPEKIMAKMEENLGIKLPPKKPATVLKPGFEQGRAGGVAKGAGKKLSAAEFEALSDEERVAYLESQKPKSDR